MSIRVQFKRGTKEALDKYTGRDGEIVIDSESKRIRVCDGVHAGGSFEVGSTEDAGAMISVSNSEPSTLEKSSGVIYPSANKITSSLNGSVSIASLQNDIWGYKNTKNYTVGTFVVYNSDLYQCIQANGPSSTVANPSNVLYWSQIPTLADLETLVVPTGTVLLYAGTVLPNGYLGCQGATFNPVTYEKLYNRIGTTYGGTAESPLLPDFRNRYPIGAGTNAVGTYIAEQLPNITGDFNMRKSSGDTSVLSGANGAFSTSTGISGNTINLSSTAYNGTKAIFKASDSNAVYTASGKVYPASLALNFIIKT